MTGAREIREAASELREPQGLSPIEHNELAERLIVQYMEIGDGQVPWMSGEISAVALECPSCKRLGLAKVIWQARDRPVAIRVTDGFTILLNSTLEVKCGRCGSIVYIHRDTPVLGNHSQYDEMGHLEKFSQSNDNQPLLAPRSYEGAPLEPADR